MSDTLSYISNFVAIIFSAFAVYYTYSSRNEARRAADEASKTRKLAQSDSLRLHFHNVEALFKIQEEVKSQELREGADSLRELMSVLGNDLQLQPVLELLQSIVNNPHVKTMIESKMDVRGTVHIDLKNFDELRKVFNERKNEYLYIA